MDKSIEYTKNVAIVLLTGLVLFITAGVVAVVLQALSWEVLGELAIKATTVAGVLLVGNFLVSFLLSAVSRK